jgi:hypothetical protein
MKKAIVITLVTLAICAGLIVWWNPVIVVHSYSENRTWVEYSDPYAKRLGQGQSYSTIITVVVKQRLLTGEVWKEYVR